MKRIFFSLRKKKCLMDGSQRSARKRLRERQELWAISCIPKLLYRSVSTTWKKWKPSNYKFYCFILSPGHLQTTYHRPTNTHLKYGLVYGIPVTCAAILMVAGLGIICWAVRKGERLGKDRFQSYVCCRRKKASFFSFYRNFLTYLFAHRVQRNINIPVLSLYLQSKL